ncbi:MAG: hypothetical protein HC808_14165 [Candidatus Competibacteraceae bacterium]|nr:hypothetical protein [Candidatus Competibacteraceae bacterium]
MGWFYTIVPAAFILMMLAGLELVCRDVAALLSGDRSYDLQRVDPSPESE